MQEMIEVTKEHFHENIMSLNVHYTSYEFHGEWKLNGTQLIAKTTPGYGNNYVNGKLQQKQYFVIPEYGPSNTTGGNNE